MYKYALHFIMYSIYAEINDQRVCSVKTEVKVSASLKYSLATGKRQRESCKKV